MLTEILRDYESYLISEDLLLVGDLMTVVPCGRSINENVQYRLYFEPSRRSSKVRSKFIGLYNQKCVRYLCLVGTVITGVFSAESGFEITSTEKGNLSGEEKERVLNAIADCTYFGSFAQEDHRYYLFEEVCPTEINKTSKGGIWGPRVFNLTDWLGYDTPTASFSTKEAANNLLKQSFE